MTIANPITRSTYVSDGYRTGRVRSSVCGNGVYMAPVYLYDNVPQPACLNSVALSQTLIAAGLLTLAPGPGNSVIVFSNVGGVIQLDCPRTITITGQGTPTIFTVTGWDKWKRLISEQILLPGGSVRTVYGRKAFDKIASISGNASVVGNVQVGCADTFGLPYVAMDQNYITPRWNGADDFQTPRVVTGTSAAMVAGVTTINNPNVKANSVIVTTTNTVGGTQGFVQASPADIVPGVSFKIRSLAANATSQGADTSTVNWEILTPSQYCGTATLAQPVGGGATTVTIPSSVITSGSVIQVFRGLGALTGGGALGNLSIGAITPGVSFVINSDSNNDTSLIYWRIVNTNFVGASSPVNLSQATLVAGTVTVNTPYVTANSIIEATINTDTGAGKLSVPVGSITPGTSFIINSSGGGGDTSIVNWRISNPATAGTYYPGDTTNPATSLTGDAIGTYTPSTPSDGIKRLTIYEYVRAADAVSDEYGRATNNTTLLSTEINEIGPSQLIL